MRRLWTFLTSPATWGALFTVTVALLIGFGIGLAISQNAKDEAVRANETTIREIAARQHDGCVASNASRQVLRDVVMQAYAPRPAVVLPPDPSVDPAVIAYLQRLVAPAAPDTTARDRVLAAIPADTNCTTVVHR